MTRHIETSIGRYTAHRFTFSRALPIGPGRVAYIPIVSVITVSRAAAWCIVRAELASDFGLVCAEQPTECHLCGSTDIAPRRCNNCSAYLSY